MGDEILFAFEITRSCYWTGSKIGKVLLATITSNTSRAADPAHLLIDVSTPAGKATGLRQNSVVSCINIVLASKTDLDQKVGEFSDALMSQIDDCLKAAFGLQ